MMAQDAVLCTDGHATYERTAKDEKSTHFALNARGQSKSTPRSHHINTVNALIGRFRTSMQLFCAPTSKSLTAHGRWYAVRDKADRCHIDVVRLLLPSDPQTYTVC
jgi:hypothetical protein